MSIKFFNFKKIKRLAKFNFFKIFRLFKKKKQIVEVLDQHPLKPNLNSPVESRLALLCTDFGVFDALLPYRVEEYIKSVGLVKTDQGATLMFLSATTLAWAGLSGIAYIMYGAKVFPFLKGLKTSLDILRGKQISRIQKPNRFVNWFIERCLKQTGFVKNTGLPRRFFKSLVPHRTKILYFSKIGYRKPYCLVIEPSRKFFKGFVFATRHGWCIIIRSIAK